MQPPVGAQPLVLNLAATEPAQLMGLSAQVLDDQVLRQIGDWPQATGQPAAEASASAPVGHLKCVVDTVINCTNRTVTLSAFLESLFTGERTAVTAPWSTGATAHSIIVSAAGIYSWNTAGYTCDHFNNTVEINEFFGGTITLTGPAAKCPGTTDSLL
ncbi:MAG TPA: hypothetical protein PK858_04245, partial [Saprospiraceae bacterium]|nr:hypothetical protein [Saprospiraceae bacterium]